MEEIEYRILFGQNLKSFRESLGESRTRFASDCGFSMYTIQNYEIGRKSPNLERLLQICNVKKVLPSRLFCGVISTPTEEVLLQELETCLGSVKLSEKQRIMRLLDIWIDCMLDIEPKLCRAGLGERIRILRVNAGLKQDDLADACKISVSTLQGYESGQCDPSISALLHLCRVFQVSLDYLLYPRLQWEFLRDSRMFQLLPRQMQALLQSAQYLKSNFVIL